jgi:coenzyme F420-reducing hydrogenase beta subunit
MNPDNEGFLYPEVNEGACIHCDLCIKICPIIKEDVKFFDNDYPIAYAVINNNEIIRNKSTSGGIFTLLAEKIIDRNGLVFGAKFDDNFCVIHSSAHTIDGIGEFRGSKYVQSVIGETFKDCKNNLDNGISVLFSGTPCQIGGLKAYLQKDYKNLFCVDLVCMSVPSPKIWKKYIEYRTQISGSQPRRIAFRYKKPSWKRSSMYFEFKNNSAYIAAGTKDPFLCTFTSDICARYSCYTCNYRTLKRQSDITIADFWGIEHIAPEMDDDKGTSLVLINSFKGEMLLEKIKNKCAFKSIDIENAVKYNLRATKSRKIKNKQLNKRRKKLFNYLDILPFDKLVKKYVYDPITIRSCRFIRRYLGKIKRSIINRVYGILFPVT